jgi:hypothetical protein
MMKQIVGASTAIEVAESDLHSGFRRLSDRRTGQRGNKYRCGHQSRIRTFKCSEQSRASGVSGEAHDHGHCHHPFLGHGAEGILAADTRCSAGLLWEPVGRGLSGDHGGGVYFTVAVGGDTGVVFGAVFVGAEGKVRDRSDRDEAGGERYLAA